MTFSGDTDALRWGVLGTGGIARSFASDLIGNDFHVQAVGSRTADAAEGFAGEFGIGSAHGSYEELAADPDVDVIYVASPHPFHAEHALLALEHGKHVLVEKPFTLTADEARAVVAAAEERGLVVLEAMWTRFTPTMVRLRELIAQGAIGEVLTLVADHLQALPTDPGHRVQAPALGGGALLDLAIYPISFAYDLFGEPRTVLVESTPTATGVDARESIVFGYERGRQASLVAGLDAAGPNRAAVVGTAGWIELDRVWYEPTSFTVYGLDGTVTSRFDRPDPNGRGMHYQAAELERIVAEGALAGTILPPAESVAIMATLDRIRDAIGLRYPSEASAAGD